jgi:hypothetical protein
MFVLKTVAQLRTAILASLTKRMQRHPALVAAQSNDERSASQ